MDKISNDSEYKEVLEQIERVFDSLPNTKEGEELVRLVKLIEDWEDKMYPI